MLILAIIEILTGIYVFYVYCFFLSVYAKLIFSLQDYLHLPHESKSLCLSITYFIEVAHVFNPMMLSVCPLFNKMDS